MKQKKVLSSVKRFFARITAFWPERFRWALIPTAVVLAFLLVASLLIFVFSRDLPSLSTLEHYDPMLVTRIYSADGKLLKELYMQNRQEIRLEQVPENMIQAVISTEDRRFFDHWGFDLRRFFKAVFVDVTTLSKRQGAGTITGQLARKLYLNPKKTWARKIREALTAVQIERTYSKPEILEMYLNHMFFENRAYGVQAAAQRYFNKNIEDLKAEESALLVGILQRPADYSPFKHPEAALGRRNIVLRNMMNCGYLTMAGCDSLRQLPLSLADTREKDDSTVAPYFCEYVRQMLEAKYGVGVVTDGLSIYTTLDSRIQACAEKAVAEKLPLLEKTIQRRILNKKEFAEWIRASGKDPNNMKGVLADTAFMDSLMAAKARLQVAMVVQDPTNGHILAMIGGRDFQESKFNRAVQAQRQPGSAFKPMVYTVAIDNGYPPCFELLNQPVSIPMIDGTIWRPRNYYDDDAGGPTTLREGLKRSLNYVCARLVTEVIPPAKVASFAKHWGFTTDIEGYYGISLGIFEVIPLELVSAYTAFANGGVRVDPAAILRVEDKNGNVLEEAVPKSQEIFSEATAYIMTSMLRDVVAHGTGYATCPYYHFCRPAAGKTGTTNDYTDAWFIGFTPQICAGVWVGFDDKRISLGDRQSGAVVALPIWAPFMKMAYDTLQLPEADFKQPADVVWIKICDESKKLATRFCPKTMPEVFRKDLVPQDSCSVHATSDSEPRKGTEEVF
jgi:penicillin-binding protein 1A